MLLIKEDIFDKIMALRMVTCFTGEEKIDNKMTFKTCLRADKKLWPGLTWFTRPVINDTWIAYSGPRPELA